MNQNNPPVLRALYIILVPVVILIIILNTGILQRVVPAASIHGRSYSVSRYNYYYFSCYNDFLEENEARLAELGYDPSLSDSAQYYPDSDPQITWKQYFIRQAEANMAETAYYCDLAQAAGYAFSDEELLPVQERLEKNRAAQAANGISAANYYVAYYGRGMTESIYLNELTRQVQAQAYKEHLIAEAAAQIQVDVPAQSASGDYNAVDLRVITLEALPDRETGLVGQAELSALWEKLDRLAARYAAGEDFQALQEAFSTGALGDRDGYLTSATRADVPDCVAAWCFTDQLSLPVGSTAALLDEDTGIAYFTVLTGYGETGAALEAQRIAARTAVETEAAAQIAESYTVIRRSFGMRLATA